MHVDVEARELQPLAARDGLLRLPRLVRAEALPRDVAHDVREDVRLEHRAVDGRAGGARDGRDGADVVEVRVREQDRVEVETPNSSSAFSSLSGSSPGSTSTRAVGVVAAAQQEAVLLHRPDGEHPHVHYEASFFGASCFAWRRCRGTRRCSSSSGCRRCSRTDDERDRLLGVLLEQQDEDGDEDHHGDQRALGGARPRRRPVETVAALGASRRAPWRSCPSRRRSACGRCGRAPRRRRPRCRGAWWSASSSSGPCPTEPSTAAESARASGGRGTRCGGADVARRAHVHA